MTDKKTKLETLIEDARAMLDDYVKPPNPVFMYSDLRRKLAEVHLGSLEELEYHLVETIDKVEKILQQAQVIAKYQGELMDTDPCTAYEIEVLRRNSALAGCRCTTRTDPKANRYY